MRQPYLDGSVASGSSTFPSRDWVTVLVLSQAHARKIFAREPCPAHKSQTSLLDWCSSLISFALHGQNNCRNSSGCCYVIDSDLCYAASGAGDDPLQQEPYIY